MELKDVILSTLEELEHSKDEIITKNESESRSPLYKERTTEPFSPHQEELFLQNIKERVHVLFEGFQSPNNTNIEAKVDLTLNFLEYLLSTIETRLAEIKQS